MKAQPEGLAVHFGQILEFVPSRREKGREWDDDRCHGGSGKILIQKADRWTTFAIPENRLVSLLFPDHPDLTTPPIFWRRVKVAYSPHIFCNGVMALKKTFSSMVGSVHNFCTQDKVFKATQNVVFTCVPDKKRPQQTWINWIAHDFGLNPLNSS